MRIENDSVDHNGLSYMAIWLYGALHATERISNYK